MHLFLCNICCFLCLFACACLFLLHCECVCVWLFMGGQADAAEPTAAWRAIEAGTHTRVHTLYTHEHNFVYTTSAQTAHKCDAWILKWHLKRHVEHEQICGRTNMRSWTHTHEHMGLVYHVNCHCCWFYCWKETTWKRERARGEGQRGREVSVIKGVRTGK